MHREEDTHGERDKSTWRDTHRDMQDRGTHKLRETPSSRKRHTVLRPRHKHTDTHKHTHAHTERVKHKQGEQEHTHTLRETQKNGERDRH